MRDNRQTSFFSKTKRHKDCTILATARIVMCKAIPITVQENLPQIIIKSDSKLVVSVINGKISLPKDIVNLEELSIY